MPLARFYLYSQGVDVWVAPESIAPAVTSRAFTAGAMADFLARHGRLPLKAALLHQKGFPGIGNWMADEILWRAGLSPERLSNQTKPAELARLNLPGSEKGAKESLNAILDLITHATQMLGGPTEHQSSDRSSSYWPGAFTWPGQYAIAGVEIPNPWTGTPAARPPWRRDACSRTWR